jgi:2-aminoadipate transaminase
MDAAPTLGPFDELARDAAEQEGLISFAGGLPDAQLFPKRQLGAAFLKVLSAPSCAALQYGWPEGSAPLRERIAERLVARGAHVTAADVIVTSGAQQAILIALAVAPRKDTVGVDDECYPGALAIFRGAGASLNPLLAESALYYAMPSMSNPRGQRMPAAERARLLELARAHDGYIIEDDAYEATDFRGETSRPLLAEAPDRVFHVGTFSKTLCPGLRVGWLVAPRAFAQRALERKQNQDLQASSLSQELLVEYLKHEDFDRHLSRLRSRYLKKRKRLEASVREHLPQLRWTSPSGGFSLWLEGDHPLAGEDLLRAAVDEGVAFDPGESFRRAPSPHFALRLCYSAVPERQIERGIIRLARALRKASSG